MKMKLLSKNAKTRDVNIDNHSISQKICSNLLLNPREVCLTNRATTSKITIFQNA